ncbi:hypothetical protein [Devosia aquimaris]|uniref:hypothetical protein n=1 Tax=Devosia aquimaris TaxID=2866214 RepID=UPI001CD0636D|nr:hypothetical protein [Devosia sp. CJK-A8-3]
MDRLIKELSVRFDPRPRLDWLTGLRLPIIVLLAIASWLVFIAIGVGLFLLVRQFL